MRGAIFVGKGGNASNGRLSQRLIAAGLALAPLIGILLVGLVWQLLSLRYPVFILPGPVVVGQRFIEAFGSQRLLFHAAVTMSEAVPGLLCGTLAAFLLGYPVAKLTIADRILSPLIVASQGVPFVAVAPLLFIWFGSGWLAKVLVCTLIVFFPIVINVIGGLRSVQPLWQDLFRAMQATQAQLFWKLELPAALPFIFTGLRVGGTLAMVGAITGEFLSSTQGLGFLVNVANGQYDTPLVIVGVISMIVCALLIYGCVRGLERGLRVS